MLWAAEASLRVNSGSGNTASDSSSKSGSTGTHDGDAEGCGYMEESGEGWDDGEIGRKVGRSENFAAIFHPVYILWSTVLRHCLLQTEGKMFRLFVVSRHILGILLFCCFSYILPYDLF